MAHFACKIYMFDTTGNALFKTENRSFNGLWCGFAELDPTDVRANGSLTGGVTLRSKILYYPGANTTSVEEFFVAEDIYTLNHLANNAANISS